MKNKVVAIIGGSQEQTFKKIGKKLGCDVIFHNGKSRNGGTKKAFAPLIEKADCVVMLSDACGHIAMDLVKKLCKENNVQIVYPKGFGASGGLTLALNALEEAAVA